jgi:hypothetical protein
VKGMRMKMKAKKTQKVKEELVVPLIKNGIKHGDSQKIKVFQVIGFCINFTFQKARREKKPYYRFVSIKEEHSCF